MIDDGGCASVGDHRVDCRPSISFVDVRFAGCENLAVSRNNPPVVGLSCAIAVPDLEFHRRPRFGARCESADAAAVFETLLVLPSRSTLDAARAALALVFRDLAIVAPYIWDASCMRPLRGLVRRRRTKSSRRP